MDSNWNSSQAVAPTGPTPGVGSNSNASLDWRLQLQPDARQRIVNRLMDTLKRHLPVPVPEGLSELQKIAVRFEEKIYSAATSQPDYLRKISLKTLSMETKTQPGLNAPLSIQGPLDQGSYGISKDWNSSQPSAPTGPTSGVGSDSNASLDWRLQLQPDARQRIVNKIMDTLKRQLPVPVPERLSELQKIAVRFEENIYSAATSQPDYLRKISLKMLSMETKTQSAPLSIQGPLDQGVGMTSQQPGINAGQSLGILQTMNQAPASRQLQQLQQQQLLQGSPIMPSALPGGPSGAAIPRAMSGPAGIGGPGGPTGTLQTDMYLNSQRMQQPQQLTSQNQMLYHQQQLAMRQKLQQQQQQTQMQMSSALAGGSGMMSTAPTGRMPQSQLNSVQQQPVGQGRPIKLQNLIPQQQQHLQAALQNPTIPMQQTNNVADVQQQQLQMRNQMQQSQIQLNQLQQKQMQQNQMQRQAGLLQQHRLSQLQSQQQASVMQQREMQMQQQRMQGTSALLQTQNDTANDQQRQQQQQFIPQKQQQQQQASMMQQREMQMQQQQMQGSSALRQTQNGTAIDQQRQQQQQFIPQKQQQQQQQRRIPDVASSSASIDSTAGTGNPGDWQEEIYQKLTYLKETYYGDLKGIHLKLSMKLSQLENVVLPNARGGEQVEKMKQFKVVLERMMAVLQLSKQNLQINLKDKLAIYEKQILSILQNHKKVPQQQSQAGASSDQPQFPPLQQSQSGMQSQKPQQQQQLQQIDNHSNQLQQQLNPSAMPQSNNLGISNSMQQGMQDTLQSDRLLPSSTGFGLLQQGGMGPTMQNIMNPPQIIDRVVKKPKKCKICGDCSHKRRNSN